MNIKLIKDAKRAWRYFSVQALAVLGIVSVVWPVLPPETQALVPAAWHPWILGAVAIGGIFGRLVDQGPRE